MRLPIDALRGDVVRAVAEAPLVLSAPTGSGKSTQVPRWLEGEVVVVEPRRVACRSLASRVAELEGVPLGGRVGYRVRDDRREGRDTRVRFITPGIALRDLALLERADVVVLDELHERRLDVDLLLGLLRERGGGLVAMSATMDGDRVARFLGGTHLRGEGRLHPVDVRYLGADRPTPKDLASRVRRAVDASASDPGDVLVFLPGRAEIAACRDALRGELSVCELHGGLSLKQQTAAFAPAKRRKVVLATNVAETSVTIPGIGVVIDSGLVRRTRYHHGRAYLGLTAIAADSAEQRAGRAGRTAPGVAYRLWSEAAILEKRTPPEVHRESLVPMVLAAASAGHRLESLPLLDAPKDYALEAAHEELAALGALDADGGLTELGRELFGRPLDPPLARLLIEAEGTPALDDVIDLVAALSVGRPLFTSSKTDDPDDLRAAGCDAVAAIRVVRRDEAPRVSAFAKREARRMAERLRAAHGREAPDPDASIDRRVLAEVVLRGDPRTAHVARRRKRRVAFANGGTELVLGRDSAVDAERVEAVAVLDSRAIGTGRDTMVIATCAMPIPLSWIRDMGLGRDRIGRVKLARQEVVAEVERVFAKKVIDTREEVPQGALAIDAMVRLVLEGRWLRDAKEQATDRLTARALASGLSRAGVSVHGVALPDEPAPSLEDHLRERLTTLGVASGADAALITAEDLLPDDLPDWVREVLDKEYPRTFEAGDAKYEIDYDLERRQVVLRMVKGTRGTAPPASYLPRFRGFRVCVESARGMHVVRERSR